MASPARRDSSPVSGNLDMSLFEAKHIEGESESYEVLESIARGSNADLYLVARRGALGVDSLMVLKRMQEGHARDASAVESFLQEARISVRLRHPNIVTTFGCGEDRGVPYLTMEYLEGGSLRDIAKACRKKKVRLTADIVVFIACEVLKGLHHAHTLRDYDGSSLSFVHRDLSPHNVFVTHEGWVKLIDFGISKTTLQNEKTATGIVKGKCAYVAPEQVVGDPLDARTDIFSLGIVLWELLTGRRLMNGTSTYEIMMRVLNTASPAPSTLVPDLPPGLDAIIVKALSRDPNERFASADAMRKALRAPNCLGATPAASAEELAGVMAVLFGSDHAAKKESIQQKMAALGRGGAALESGPVPRASRLSPTSSPTSSVAAIPVPVTSSVRLVRDTCADETQTKLQGKKAISVVTPKQEAAGRDTVIDDEYDVKTRFDADFRIPQAAIPEEYRGTFDSDLDEEDDYEDLDSEIDAESHLSAWKPTFTTRTEPMPERVASLPPPPSETPSQAPAVAADSTGPMRARTKTRLRSFAYFVTDVLVIALALGITMRVYSPHHGMKNMREIRLESAVALATIGTGAASVASHIARLTHK
ncbi:MAG: serine/threonine-protein kinase [Polyangiaceae bacterium]